MEKLTAEQVQETALNIVDDYLQRNATETISFYNMDDQYSPAGGRAIMILTENGLVRERAGKNSLTDLTEVGRTVLEFGGIRKYLAAKSAVGMLRADNELLQNKILKFQHENGSLDRDLKIAQANLTEQQSRELKHKRLWGIAGAILGALFTYAVDHFLMT